MSIPIPLSKIGGFLRSQETGEEHLTTGVRMSYICGMINLKNKMIC